MPISVTCPECNSTYRVADEAAGKAIKCKKCGARVPVPGDGAAEAASAGAASNGDDTGAEGGGAPAKKKSSTGKTIAIVAGALVGACCICTGIVGVGGYWAVGKAKEASKDIAEQFNKGFEEAVKKAQKEQQGQKGGVVAAGPTILDKRDALTSKDQKIVNGKPTKVYKVRLEPNKDYVIDMKAERRKSADDPYLILLDPQNKEVARDDDSGGELDAQISYRPTAAGEYTIQATCYIGVGAEGLPFHLTVKVK
jgi:predicted Zn finger-like uncharacterized protein